MAILQVKDKNGNFINIPSIIGKTGPANILTIGNVEKGDEANATITGASPFQVLNLTLPKGDKGEQGIQGIQGEKGPKGDAFTYEDFTDEQLEGLRGPQGIQGVQGPQGPKGDKGEQGEQGPRGEDGKDGVTPDLTDYYTKEEIDTNFYTKVEIDATLGDIQFVLNEVV